MAVGGKQVSNSPTFDRDNLAASASSSQSSGSAECSASLQNTSGDSYIYFPHWPIAVWLADWRTGRQAGSQLVKGIQAGGLAVCKGLQERRQADRQASEQGSVLWRARLWVRSHAVRGCVPVHACATDAPNGPTASDGPDDERGRTDRPGGAVVLPWCWPLSSSSASSWSSSFVGSSPHTRCSLAFSLAFASACLLACSLARSLACLCSRWPEFSQRVRATAASQAAQSERVSERATHRLSGQRAKEADAQTNRQTAMPNALMFFSSYTSSCSITFTTPSTFTNYRFLSFLH